MERIPQELPQSDPALNFRFTNQRTADRVFADSEVKRVLGHSILSDEASALAVREKVNEVVRTELGPSHSIPEDELTDLVNDRLLIYLNNELATRQDTTERHRLEELLEDAEKRASFDRFGFLRPEQFYRAGTKQMQALVESAKEANEALPRFVVIRTDLIGFKQVNDILGHKVGDDYIKDAGNILNNNLPFSRNNDCLLGHTGGDEFSLLFINFSDQEIADYLDTVRLATNYVGFSNYINRERDDDETLSVGIIEWDPKLPLDLEVLDELADQQEISNHKNYYILGDRNRRGRKLAKSVDSPDHDKP